MKLYEIISGAQGGQAIDNLARAANVEPEQMDGVFRTVLPAFSNAIERNTLSRGGLADLVKALGDGHHEVILDNPQAMADPRVVQDGNEILGYVLGSKDRSRGVAMQAAQASGLSEGLIRMLLPYIAQMVMGAIAKWAKGGLGDVVQKIPGGGGGGGLPFPMPQGSPRSDGGGGYEIPRGGTGGGGGGGGGFELPRGELPQGGYPMPPIPGGPGGGGRQQPPRQDDDGNDRGQHQGGGGGFQIPWPRNDDRGQQQGGGAGVPFPFPSPQSGGQQRGDGGFQIPWPRQRDREPERRGGGSTGGFELPHGELPDGGYPMPPIPGGTGGRGGSTGSFPAPQGGGMGGGSGSPLPLPGGGGGNNPYGDLSDILRRGGQIGGAPSGGLVRNILGSLLGFRGGLMSWLFRLIVMRFGWGLLKRFLGRALTGGR